MALSARTIGNLQGAADIETFGAGTVMLGKTKVEIYPVNQIIVGQNAILEAQGEQLSLRRLKKLQRLLRVPQVLK